MALQSFEKIRIIFVRKQQKGVSPMKFFHLSDLHIGLKLYNRELYEDQTDIFDQIAAAARAEQPDAVVIAGDIYDKAVPSGEAVAVFDHFLTKLTQAVPTAEIMMISGNHDSAPRINVFRAVLQRHRIHMIGLPPQAPAEHIEQVTLHDSYGPVHFYLLPFVKPSMVKAIVGTDDNGNNLTYDETIRRLLAREEIQEAERNVLVSHQFYLPVGENPEDVERMESEICTVGNIDSVRADVLAPFDYAALGHIHKPMKVGSDRCRYCGTPLTCSVSEAGQQKGIVVVELGEKGTVSTKVLPLHPLREVKLLRGTLEEVLTRGCGDYVSVSLTDQVDLDVLDMQDRLRNAFPNLLEIRRETVRMADYRAAAQLDAELDAFSLCCSFLKDLDDEEQALLRDVINTVQEVQG